MARSNAAASLSFLRRAACFSSWDAAWSHLAAVEQLAGLANAIGVRGTAGQQQDPQQEMEPGRGLQHGSGQLLNGLYCFTAPNAE